MPAGAAAVPAVDADRLRIAEQTGRAAVALIGSEIRSSQIINDQALENALRVLLAIGGSTNAVIHLAAIAEDSASRLISNSKRTVQQPRDR